MSKFHQKIEILKISPVEWEAFRIIGFLAIFLSLIKTEESGRFYWSIDRWVINDSSQSQITSADWSKIFCNKKFSHARSRTFSRVKFWARDRMILRAHHVAKLATRGRQVRNLKQLSNFTIEKTRNMLKDEMNDNIMSANLFSLWKFCDTLFLKSSQLVRYLWRWMQI